jgi:hypothetical protein
MQPSFVISHPKDAISHALSIGNLDLAKQIAEMPTDEDVKNSEELRYGSVL